MSDFWNNLDLGGVLKEGFSKGIDTVSGAYLAKLGVYQTAEPTEQYGEQLPPTTRPQTITKAPTIQQEPQPVEKENLSGVLAPKIESSDMWKIGGAVALVVMVALIARKG